MKSHFHFNFWGVSSAWALSICVLCGTLAANEYVLTLLEKVRLRYNEEAYQHMLQLRDLSSQVASGSELTKVTMMNDFINQHVLFADDIDLWGLDDYWATPLETFGRGAGDCEDFSIAKFMMLKKIGVAADKLRMTYVKARMPSGNLRAHMVLAYYSRPSADPLILDNLSHELLPASRRSDLYPIFSFNDQGLFIANNPTVRAGSPTNISKWRDLLSRMRQDGLE